MEQERDNLAIWSKEDGNVKYNVFRKTGLTVKVSLGKWMLRIIVILLA
jgi:hypothetical protein